MYNQLAPFKLKAGVRDEKKPNTESYRCEWCGSNQLMVKYHDEEWGVPAHNDDTFFEFLILEGAQAGLTWQTVLNKRENYRKAFRGFDAKIIAHYGAKDIKRLLADAGIIRNRLKVAATIQNAKKFLEIQKEFGSFDAYIWQFVGGKQMNNKIKSMKDIPVTTKESDAMSKDLLKRGFKFVGSTICYAFMQAVGMVNDHEIRCFRYALHRSHSRLCRGYARVSGRSASRTSANCQLGQRRLH